MPLALLDHIHLQPYHWNYVASKCSYKLVICQHCVHTSRIKILVKSVRVGACLLSTNCFAHKTLYVHSFHHFPSAALHHGKYQGTCSNRWYVIQVSLTFQFFYSADRKYHYGAHTTWVLGLPPYTTIFIHYQVITCLSDIK